MSKRRLISVVLALCLLLTVITPASVCVSARASVTENVLFELLNGDLFDWNLLNKDLDADLKVDKIEDDEIVKILIIMDSLSVVETDGTAVYDENTQEMMDELAAEQAQIVESIEENVLDGESLQINYSYTWLLNGIATEVPYELLSEIRKIDGVKQVLLQPQYEVCSSDVTALSDAQLQTISTGTMIGRESAWAQGYTGKGIKIAVIDTGLDEDHQNFQPLPDEKLTEDSADEETVSAVLDQLKASSRRSGLTSSDLYRSTKVVFGFNYADNNLDITHDNDDNGDHGTHVAGIAAANKVDDCDVVGVAPDAQLYVMKVYGYDHGGYAEDILAALEDALLLGADVINMSLGTNAGFTSNSEEVDAIYDRVALTNSVLSVSAGNNYTAGYSNMWGTNANQTKYPDNAVIGEPGVYSNVLSIASVENCAIQRYYIAAGDKKLAFNETSSSYGLPSVMDMEGEYRIVLIPNNGAIEDYEGLDMTGKIALVQRGGISFVDKCQNAALSGAAACIVYNNTSGEFGMDLTDYTTDGTLPLIPCISVTMEDGEYLAASTEADPAFGISFPNEMASIPSVNAYEMSDFSSWGVAPDLSLEPDITAPGGNVYSTINDGQYGLMSGTSMAAPNLSGLAALVMQYVKQNYPDTDIPVRELVQDLLVSTSVPLDYGDEGNLYYSPRQQGSGLANAFNAICTQVYLRVEGMDSPKIELGQDTEKTGEYNFTFDVVNFGTGAAYYDLGTLVQTEGYTDAGYEGMYFMSGAPIALAAKTTQVSAGNMVLTHDVSDNGTADTRDAYQIYLAATEQVSGWSEEAFRYDLDQDEAVTADDVQQYLNALVGLDSAADLSNEVLKVEAGETVEVSVSIELDEADKDYFETYYPNGGYVEGFAVLTAKNSGGVDLSLPYMAFYGSWDDAPIIDDGYFWDYAYAEEGDVVGNQYINVLWTQLEGASSAYYPGVNVYVEEDAVDLSHISLSPNGDGYIDTIDDIYISLLRNARYLTFRYLDTDTGEVYYEQTVEYISKSAYSSSYGQIVPTIYSWFDGEIPLYNFTDAEGKTLLNNTHLLLQVEAVGDYEGATTHSWGVPVEVGYSDDVQMGVPITIDLEAPELLELEKTVSADGTVTLDLAFRDNLSVAAVALMNSNGREVYHMEGTEDPEPDADGYRNYTATFDITDLTGKMVIVLSDYALNEHYYAMNLNGEGADYGDLVAYQYNILNETDGWVSFSQGVNENEIQINMDEMGFMCAEYVDGFIYAQTDSGALYGFRYSDLLSDNFDIEGAYITELEDVYQDLAYNYVDGTLYGLYVWEDGDYPYSTINSINIYGDYVDPETNEQIPAWYENWAYQRGGLYALCLTVDDEGTMYLLGLDTEEDTVLWRSCEREGYTGTFFEEVMELDLPMDFAQSMTYNHNDGKLYWAQFYPTGVFEFDCGLYTIDVENQSYEKVGTLGGETVGLFAPLSPETIASNDIYLNVPAVDPSVPGTPVLRRSVINMNMGSTQQLLYDVDPWYSEYQDMVWSSSDEAVATVDENGIVTAVGIGTCTITVANTEDMEKLDTCTVNVSALSVIIEGIVTAQSAGLGNSAGSNLYKFEMLEGIASMGTTFPITASEEFSGFGLDIATSVFARDSVWACEYGNSGMIYQIDPATGEVLDMLMPVDGDMLFGLTYNENLDTFTGIMNMYLYVDLTLTHEESELIMDSYNDDLMQYDYHRVNMLEHLLAAGGNFVTGENGQGASSEIVMCGITTITEPYTYVDTAMDFLGQDSSSYEVNYTSTQTLVVLDNVGRLWYIDEICGMTKSGNNYRNRAEGYAISSKRNGVMAVENADGTYNVFYIRALEETVFTDMFRDGTLPRITYHFSDIEFGGYTEDGAPIFAMSMYDYWNNGTTNELYVYIPATATSEEMCYYLGTTGQYNIIASIHNFELTGGLED